MMKPSTSIKSRVLASVFCLVTFCAAPAVTRADEEVSTDGRLDGYGTNAAQAQARPGEYIMLAGDVVGGPSSVIYMIDETNRKLSARTYDENKRLFSDMAPIDLDRVFDPRANR